MSSNPSPDKRLRHLAKRRDESGRRRPTHLKDWERDDILVLANAGYPVADIVTLTDRSVDAVRWVLAEERDRLRRKHADEANELVMAAARVAAEKGDHRPAMEWLDRNGAIPETSRQRTAVAIANITADAQRHLTKHLQGGAPRSGPTVNIGFGLPAQLTDGDSQSVQISVTPGDSTALNNRPRTDIHDVLEPKLLGAVGTLEG